MPLITSGFHSISKIPVEIWDEILNLATTVEKGDEFGHHSTLCAILNYHGDIIFDCHVSPEDQKYALATRQSVVLVCRAWHQVATRFLWSHLIISIDLWTSESFNPVFPSLSELLYHVKRLDIVQSLEGESKFQEISLTRFKHVLANKIYPRMSNLRILCAPQNLATGNYACSPTIVSLHPADLGQLDFQLDEREGWFQWDGGKHFWTSARILDLDMDMSVLSDDSLKAGDHIIFPQLKKLGIQYLQSDCIVDHIIQHWKTPVFSLRDCYTDRGFDLLAWSSDNVTTLELSNFSIVASTTILMPRLASIIVKQHFYYGWEDLIQAPSLNKLSFSDSGAERLYQQDRVVFARHLSKVVERYPMCTSVSFFKYGFVGAISGTGSIPSEPVQGQEEVCQPNPEQSEASANVLSPVFEFDPTNPHERIMAIERQWLSPE
jgi:hypothetical protein